jgi:cell division protein FtsN
VRDGQRPGIPGWIWLATGMLMGLGLAVFLMARGWMPSQPEGLDRPVPRPDAEPAVSETPDDLSQPVEGEEEEWKPRYDFYTVLPEMEVVVPEQEIRERVDRREQQAASRGPYVLQVGSFRQFGDADRTKAQLALLGIIAQVKEVTINSSTWHRVRVGPYDSVREMDRVKQDLENAGHEVMVLREKP